MDSGFENVLPIRRLTQINRNKMLLSLETRAPLKSFAGFLFAKFAVFVDADSCRCFIC